MICHDPQAGDNFIALARTNGLPDPLVLADLEEALKGAHVAIVQTEWDDYRALDPEHLVRIMARPVVVDARRALDPDTMERGGVTYLGIGHPTG